MPILFFDIETKNTFEEVESTDPAKLDLSVACFAFGDDEPKPVYVEEIKILENALLGADLVVGFNIRKFDLQVLQKYMLEDLTKLPILDLFEEPTAFFGHRVSLDGFARCLGFKKLGSGLDAVKWWAEGEKQKVIKYCKEDVNITREIYKRGVKNGRLDFFSKFGSIKSCPVNWAEHKPQRTETQIRLL